MDLCWLLNMLSRLVITFLPRSKHLLILWLQSLSSVILEPPKIKSGTVSTVSPSISHEVMGPDAMIFIFWILSFKPTFSLSSFTFIKRLVDYTTFKLITKHDFISLCYTIYLCCLSVLYLVACISSSHILSYASPSVSPLVTTGFFLCVYECVSALLYTFLCLIF